MESTCEVPPNDECHNNELLVEQKEGILSYTSNIQIYYVSDAVLVIHSHSHNHRRTKPHI